MEELAALLGMQSKKDDLGEKLVTLLERQGEHGVSPNMMLSFLGMFNLWSIMNVAKSESNYAKVESSEKTNDENTNATGGNLQEALTGLLSSQAKGGGGGADLMGMLGNLAGNKKVNPAMLLPLLGMLNNQMAQPGSNEKEAASAKKENHKESHR